MRTVVVWIGCLLPASFAAGEPLGVAEVARAFVTVLENQGRLVEPCLEKPARKCADKAAKRMQAGDLARAAALFVGACHAGAWEACAGIATTFEASQTQPGLMRRYVRMGCELGHPESCSVYGDILSLGRGVPVDAVAAVPYYRRACQARLGYACHNVGLAHAQGIGGPVDDVKAARLYIEACELDARMCGDAGGRLVNGWGVEKDVERGRALLQRGCRAGETHACMLFADHLRAMDPPDLVTAFKISRSACDLGNASACRRVADAKLRGEGTPRDADGAAEYYGRAARGFTERCNDNIGRDCAFLAELVRHGLGVERNPAKADELAIRACRLDPRHCPVETSPSPAPP